MPYNTTKTWMDGGIVANRTNDIINALIDSMNEQGAYTVSLTDLNTVIRTVAKVDREETLKQYRERVAKHGPFTVDMNRYTLDPAYREG